MIHASILLIIKSFIRKLNNSICKPLKENERKDLININIFYVFYYLLCL